MDDLPHHRVGGRTEDERKSVKEMGTQGHSPAAILSTLRYANPELLLVQHDVYNLLHSLRLHELAGRTPIEWLLEVCLPRVSFLFLANNLLRNSRRRTLVHKNTQIKTPNALNGSSLHILMLFNFSKITLMYSLNILLALFLICLPFCCLLCLHYNFQKL